MVDHTLAETMRKLGESPEFYEVGGYRLKLEVEDIGEDERYGVHVPLADPDFEMRVNQYQHDFARVIEIESPEMYVRLEADHNGPRHGVDGWVGWGSDRKSKPVAVVHTGRTEEVGE